MNKLSIIIVLYNEFELVKKCLTSVYENKLTKCEVLLIDNSSDKNGHKAILKKFPKVKYIQNKENVGFGRAVNIGLKHAAGEFFLILTPDTYVLPETITKTLSYIDKNPTVGLVGCRIYTAAKIHDRSAARGYPNLIFLLYYYNMPVYKLIHGLAKDWHPINFSREDHKRTLFPKYVMGAYMLIRRKTLDETGSFDPRFKLYIEDVDLCKRIIDKGWKVVYLPVGGLVNGDGGDWKKTTITQSLPNYMESLYLFFKKHNGNLYTIVAWIISTLSALITIPYLLSVIILKTLMNKSSQSRELLPLWIRITSWHCTKGLVLLLKNYK